MAGFAERQAEWIIDNNLVNKGWHIDGDSAQKNVYLQKPKLESQLKRLKGKKPDYILYESGTDRPIAIIEAKKGGIDLKPALAQGTEYALALDAPLVFAMNGSYCETRYVPNNKSLLLNGNEVRELIREVEALKFLEDQSNEIYTIPQEVVVSREDLIRIFKNLNDTLRGEGLRAGIERFSEFANILFLKLLSENDKKSWWKSIKSQADTDIIGFVNGYVIDQIKREYGGDVFTPLLIKNPRTLRHVIDSLDPLVLSTIDTDIKGDAFEYFLEKTTSTENDLGEYFTPRNVVKTIINLVGPKFKEKIYDPFCGTGGFLTAAFHYIKENNIISDEELPKLRHHTFFGREITTTARIAKMNMILHGDGHSGITQTDSLAHPDYLDNQTNTTKFDVIVTNMPFSQTITRKVSINAGKVKAENHISPLYYNGIARNNGDAVCVLHCLRNLREGGRMALVVPEGFLFRKDIAHVREFLLSKAKLQSVISLPQGTFLPYTNVKTDILFFVDAHKQNNQKEYWFFDVKNIGTSLDSHRKKIEGMNDFDRIGSSDIKKIDKAPELKANMLEVGFEVINLEKVKNNQYNLVGSIYREVVRSGKNEFVKLGNIVKFQRGFSYKSDMLTDERYGMPMYNLKSVKIDASSGHDFKFIKFETTINNKYMCHQGDLLMAITDLTPTSEIIGRTIVTNENGAFSMDLIKLEFDTLKIYNKYLHYILNSNEFLTEARKFSVGNNVKHLNLDNVATIQIPLPPLDIQKLIANELDNVKSKITNAKEMIYNLNKNIEELKTKIWQDE